MNEATYPTIVIATKCLQNSGQLCLHWLSQAVSAILILNVFYRINSSCWNDFNLLWLWQFNSLELDYRIFYCERHKICRLHCF